jgi:DNA-binding NtrC family response regulator
LRRAAASERDRVTVLAVAPPASLVQLRRIIGHSRWHLLEAATVAEAAGLMHAHSAVVLICEATLPDGSWREVLDHTLQLPLPPPVIVAAHHADDYLWTEVLNRGAYNLLGEPFDERELFRLVSSAWLYRRAAAHLGASAG